MEYWEIIADNLSKAGWSWGCLAAMRCDGQMLWAVDAHRDDGKRFVARAGDKLTAFLELEGAIRQAIGRDLNADGRIDVLGTQREEVIE